MECGLKQNENEESFETMSIVAMSQALGAGASACAGRQRGRHWPSAVGGARRLRARK